MSNEPKNQPIGQAEEYPNNVVSSLVLLPFTQNDATKTTLGAEGIPFHHERAWALTQVAAARAILVAAARGKDVTTPTLSGTLVRWTARWFPRLLARFVRSSSGTLHSVQKPLTPPNSGVS